MFSLPPSPKKKHGAQGNFWRWRIGLLHRLWWWPHECMPGSKLSELYTWKYVLNLRINYANFSKAEGRKEGRKKKEKGKKGERKKTAVPRRGGLVLSDLTPGASFLTPVPIWGLPFQLFACGFPGLLFSPWKTASQLHKHPKCTSDKRWITLTNKRWACQFHTFSSIHWTYNNNPALRECYLQLAGFSLSNFGIWNQ